MRDAMMWAQLRDNNQGIIKLTSGGLAKSADGVPTVELDSPAGARVNGNQVMSMVVLDHAVGLAINKAKSASKIGVVGTFNTAQSMGACGERECTRTLATFNSLPSACCSSSMSPLPCPFLHPSSPLPHLSHCSPPLHLPHRPPHRQASWPSLMTNPHRPHPCLRLLYREDCEGGSRGNPDGDLP